MDKLEKAAKVREMCGVSFEDAREALEACDYDVLDAIVWLEQQGRAQTRTAEYATSGTEYYQATAEMSRAQSDYERATSRNGFTQGFARIMEAIRTLLKRGVDTSFVVTRHGKQILSIPTLILVLLLIFAFWITLPLLAIGLFFEFRYRFEGIGSLTVDINEMADKASEGVDHLKRDFRGDDTNAQ